MSAFSHGRSLPQIFPACTYTPQFARVTRVRARLLVRANVEAGWSSFSTSFVFRGWKVRHDSVRTAFSPSAPARLNHICTLASYAPGLGTRTESREGGGLSFDSVFNRPTLRGKTLRFRYRLLYLDTVVSTRDYYKLLYRKKCEENTEQKKVALSVIIKTTRHLSDGCLTEIV